MALTDFAGIGNVVAQNPSGVVGGDAWGDPNGKIAGLWLGGSVAQVQRTTITGASAKTYTVSCTIYGVTESASFVATGSPTTSTVAAGLGAAIQALPTFGSFVSVDVSSANIDTTGPLGVAFTITDSDGDITQTTTTAAVAGTTIAPGTFALVDFGKSLWPQPTFIPASALTAGTALMTMTYASGTVYTVSITVGGVEYVATHVGATDLATTRTALIAAINGAMPALTVLAATGTNAGEITLTAEIAGQAFVVVVDAHTGAGTIALTSTSGLPTDDIAACFGGFVAWSLKQDAQLGVNDIVYNPGDTLPVKARGTIFLGLTVSGVSGLFVDTTTGLPSSSGGAGKCPIPSSLGIVLAPAPEGSGLAVARLSCGTILPA